MGFFYVIHVSHAISPLTFFTVHASRTHVKALQPDLHVKPDNSSGPTHDSPLEGTFTHESDVPTQNSTEKASRTPSRERRPQARHGPTPLLAHSDPESEPRPEGQHRNPDDIPPRCPEPWKEHGKHLEDPMAPCLSHRSVQGLVWKPGFGFSLFGKKDLSFFLSLYLLLRLSSYLIEVYIIELQILQLSLLQVLRQPLQILQRSLQLLQQARVVDGGSCEGTFHRTATTHPQQRKGPGQSGIPPKTNRGHATLLRHHVSLMDLPYRLAKSLLLSRYVSVLMPFTSSTTSLPSSM